MVIILVPGSSIPEIQQAAMIVAHYDHHVQDHGEKNLGFWEYMVEHFAKRTHDDVQHKQLPFHGATNNHAPIVYVVQGSNSQTEPAVDARPTFAPRTIGVPRHLSSVVFQPPRS